MALAASVALGAAVLSLVCCAGSAWAWWSASKEAKKLRSMTSMQGELHEIRDFVSKIDAWAKRINARDVRRAEIEEFGATAGLRARTQPATSGPESPAELKARLRREAGIVPGKPVRHSDQ